MLQLRTVLSLVTVEPVLLFYMIGIFLLFSVFHNFVYERTCSSHFPTGLKEASPINGNISSNGQDVCADLTSFPVALAIVQTETSRIIKISTMCMTIPSIIVDCYLGSWSDLFGRKVTLTLPPLGSALGSLVYLILGKKNRVVFKTILLRKVRFFNLLALLSLTSLLFVSEQFWTAHWTSTGFFCLPL